jgi:dephospho-CoA kinase
VLRVGVTGGIAAGKSTAVEVLRDLGASVVDADAIAREILAAGAPAVAEVVDAFGEEVLAQDGGIDRPALGRRVFGDAAARARLEGITHPRIQAEAARRFAEAPADAVVVHDIPLLVELDLADRYHLVVVVHAPEHERIGRLVRERGMTEEDARSRVRAQASDDQRRAAADVWLDNTRAPQGLGESLRLLWRDRLVPFESNIRRGRVAMLRRGPVTVADGACVALLTRRVRRALEDRLTDEVRGHVERGVVVLDARLAPGIRTPAVSAALTAAGFPPVPGTSGIRGSADPERPVRLALHHAPPP